MLGLVVHSFNLSTKRPEADRSMADQVQIDQHREVQVSWGYRETLF